MWGSDFGMVFVCFLKLFRVYRVTAIKTARLRAEVSCRRLQGRLDLVVEGFWRASGLGFRGCWLLEGIEAFRGPGRTS